jgi:hypothetical protein
VLGETSSWRDLGETAGWFQRTRNDGAMRRSQSLRRRGFPGMWTHEYVDQWNETKFERVRSWFEGMLYNVVLLQLIRYKPVTDEQVLYDKFSYDKFYLLVWTCQQVYFDNLLVASNCNSTADNASAWPITSNAQITLTSFLCWPIQTNKICTLTIFLWQVHLFNCQVARTDEQIKLVT